MTTIDHLEVGRPKRASWITLIVAIVTLIVVSAYSLLSLHWQQHYAVVIYPLFTLSHPLLNCFLSCCILPFAASIAWTINGWQSADKAGRSAIVIFLLSAGWMFYFGYQTFAGDFFQHLSSLWFNGHIYQVAAHHEWNWEGYMGLIIFECNEQGWTCSKIHETIWYTDEVNLQAVLTGEAIELVASDGRVLYSYTP